MSHSLDVAEDVTSSRSCEHCGSPFTADARRAKTKRFCSRRCTSLAHYYANREQYNARAVQWQKDNPDAWRSIQLPARIESEHKRRSAAGPGVSRRDWQRLVRRYGYRCAYCGRKPLVPLTKDHVIPLSRGGQHAIGNILPACLSCNQAKGWRTITEWRHRGGGRKPRQPGA